MPELAPSEQEQLYARSKLLKKLRSLDEDLDKVFEQRKVQLNSFGDEAFGYAGYGLYLETLVHMRTLRDVTRELISDTIKFVEAERSYKFKAQSNAAALINDETVNALKNCVTLMGVSKCTPAIFVDDGGC